MWTVQEEKVSAFCRYSFRKWASENYSEEDLMLIPLSAVQEKVIFMDVNGLDFIVVGHFPNTIEKDWSDQQSWKFPQRTKERKRKEFGRDESMTYCLNINGPVELIQYKLESNYHALLYYLGDSTRKFWLVYFALSNKC